MSDIFEQSIRDFYDKERISSTQLLDLSEEAKVSNKDLANNIDFVIKYQVLLSRISLKHYHTIESKLENLESRVSQCEKGLQDVLLSINSSLHTLQEQVSSQKPLTKPQVKKLVEEIAQQPKLVEEQALALTANLDKKIKEIEKLVQHLVNWTSG